uniref:Zinc carboxypeptidase n=1 Tax=Candidatus Kentrum sp. LFY TaxID=2126342 RepID=A0A450UXE4_9GAMM|nr:MAG: Zinc carboxypeptidase [Candidatus Kentron sp. LFY]
MTTHNVDIQRPLGIRILLGLLIFSSILANDTISNAALAATTTVSEFGFPLATPQINDIPTAAQMCHRIGKKLGTVSVEGCLARRLSATDGLSVQRQPILAKEYFPTLQPRPRILLFGGIHGDEFSSVSIVFKWIKMLDNQNFNLFHWYVVPLLNPDGLLRKKSQRMNANDIDLNRNFPPWGGQQKASLEYWIRHAKRNPRRYPGPEPLSEPETRWLVKKIDGFRPDVIIAVHAPYGVVDFDGPPKAPQQLGRLRLNLLGTYPGSLGNYAALQRNIPVVTLELRYAGILPDNKEIQRIWSDLIQWLQKRFPDA